MVYQSWLECPKLMFYSMPCWGIEARKVECRSIPSNIRDLKLRAIALVNSLYDKVSVDYSDLINDGSFRDRILNFLPGPNQRMVVANKNLHFFFGVFPSPNQSVV